MQLLKRLYLTSSKSGHENELKKIVREALADLPDLTIQEDEIGNLMITRGVSESYPCIAAHLDEVFLPCDKTLHLVDDRMFATAADGSLCGIGADDKNGVWMAIKLLHRLDVLKVSLFVQEEKDSDGLIAGCRGSKSCILSFFDNVKYILQCDRKGSSDVVTHNKDIRFCDEDFIPEEILQQYGFKPCKGGTTDVVALLNRGVKIPVCNISCGYYNCHQETEYTCLSELQLCLSFVEAIILSL